MVVAWMTMPCRHDRLRQRRLLQPVKGPDCREIKKVYCIPISDGERQEDGMETFRVTSSGHFFSKWANFRGHFQRVNSRGHFLLNSEF